MYIYTLPTAYCPDPHELEDQHEHEIALHGAQDPNAHEDETRADYSMRQ